jgi:hypothetical protein
MKLYERFGDSGYHSAVLSTYCMDFDAFDSVALGRLRGAGTRNIILIADDKMLHAAVNAAPAGASKAGRSYCIVPAPPSALYHPKIVLQLGLEKARAIVSSANLTASGLAGNLEIATAIECEGAEDILAPLVSSVWHFLIPSIDIGQKSVSESVDWLRRRSRWLIDIPPNGEPVLREDGSRIGFFHSGGDQTICAQFVTAIGSEVIEHLTVISPYWDKDLRALRALRDTLPGSPRVSIIIDPDAGLFPVDALGDFNDIVIKNANQISNVENGSRFAHAKVIIVSGPENDHVLTGSANCTVAGLGLPNAGGANGEACVYLSTPNKDIHSILGLSILLNDPNATVEQISISPMTEVDLDNDTTPVPPSGRFEVQFSNLIWEPPAGDFFNTATIHLYDDQDRLILELAKMRADQVSSQSELTFALQYSEVRPHLARVLYDNGAISNPAIISDLVETRKHRRSSGTRHAAEILDTLYGESEVTYKFLEILNSLEREEGKESSKLPTASAINATTAKTKDRGIGATAAIEEKEVERVDYQTFIASRKLRHELDGIERDGLGSSYLASMRQVLNRIVGGLAIEVKQTEDVPEVDLNLGDETNPSGDLDGLYVDDDPSLHDDGQDGDSKEQPLTAEEIEILRGIQRKSSADHLLATVADLQKKLSAKPEPNEKGNDIDPSLSEQDLFRLRLTLTVIAAVAFDGSLSRTKAQKSGKILPSQPEKTEYIWPRLMGRLLNGIATRLTRKDTSTLNLDPTLDQLSDSILETWGTCFWCAQASILCGLEQKYSPTFIGMLENLTKKLYDAIGLTQEDLAHPILMASFDGMNKNYADSLCIDPEKIEKMHKGTSVAK